MPSLILFTLRKLLQESPSPSPSPSPIYIPTNASNSSYPYSSPYGLNTHFNPSMAIIIVVLLSAFFFMGFFSVYVRRCTTEEDRFPRSNSRPPDGRSRASHGLDTALVDTLPVATYTAAKGSKGGKQNSECVVCLSEFEENEALRLLPKCGHAFHQDCIDMWLFSHTTCPLCRRSLLPEKGSSFREFFPFGGINTAARESTLVENEHDASPVQVLSQEIPYLGSTGDGVTFAVGDLDRDHEDEVGEIERVSPTQPCSDAPTSHGGSPIYGVRCSSPGSKSRSGRSRRLRRSHSTGHSGNKVQAPTLSPAKESSQSPTFRFPLLASDFHRSRSLTAFTYQWGQQEDQIQDERGSEPRQERGEMKGWSTFSFRRPFNMRSDTETRTSTSTGEASSSTQENRQPALSPVSSVRRTFMRFTGMEKRPDPRSQIFSAQDGEFHQLSRIL